MDIHCYKLHGAPPGSESSLMIVKFVKPMSAKMDRATRGVIKGAANGNQKMPHEIHDTDLLLSTG